MSGVPSTIGGVSVGNSGGESPATWSFAWLDSVFGALPAGQFGIGPGGALVLLSLLMLVGVGLARLGYFRRDVFVAAAVWLMAIYHATNLYWAKQAGFERFILLDGAPYPLLFWAGYGLAGTAIPLVIAFHPRFAGPRATLVAAAAVVAGAFAQLYVFIIGGQAFPLEIFPGYAASSAFGDGAVARYAPSLPEFLMGLGGLALAALLAAVGARAFDVLPGASGAAGD